MTSIPEDDPENPSEDEGTKPEQHPAARRSTLEAIFKDLSREVGKSLSEIIPYLSVEAKARVLDMILARLEEREQAPEGEGGHGAHS